ncbi:hypothetical protein [Bacillus thuringiensis]|uniref:hypothetical protein n=1 Tax=Bacillus thuringiensis TaxID=1428 RepID=UPI0021D654AA|nr:hypothetical protein [Bacillus thuringiensis]MCU7668219.1 hypothetical protein [Bacillus thuringiensis]
MLNNEVYLRAVDISGEYTGSIQIDGFQSDTLYLTIQSNGAVTGTIYDGTKPGQFIKLAILTGTYDMNTGIIILNQIVNPPTIPLIFKGNISTPINPGSINRFSGIVTREFSLWGWNAIIQPLPRFKD